MMPGGRLFHDQAELAFLRTLNRTFIVNKAEHVNDLPYASIVAHRHHKTILVAVMDTLIFKPFLISISCIKALHG